MLGIRRVSSEEQQISLIAEPSLQPQRCLILLRMQKIVPATLALKTMKLNLEKKQALQTFFETYVSSPLRSLLPSHLLHCLSKFHTMPTITPVYTYKCAHSKLISA